MPGTSASQRQLFLDLNKWLCCAVQASYSAAQRLLGGFLNSSSGGSGGGSGNNNEDEANLNKAAGFFTLRRYRKHFNVDTMVGSSSCLHNALRSIIQHDNVRPSSIRNKGCLER